MLSLHFTSPDPQTFVDIKRTLVQTFNTFILQEDEEVAAEDEDDMGVIETYSNYKPTKLQIGRQHPDPVVETASLASVEPPDVW